MMTVADQIIDALGGTTAVARMTDAPLSTVHSWRKNGIPRSRMAHLRLVANGLSPAVDIDLIVDRANDPAMRRQAA